MLALHFSPALLTALLALLVATVVDTGVGILRSVVKGSFHLSFVANFLKTTILPLFGPVMLLAVLTTGFPQASTYVVAFTWAAVAKLLADISGKLGVNLGMLLPKPATSDVGDAAVVPASQVDASKQG